MFGWLINSIKGAIRLATRVVTTGWGLVLGAPDLVVGFLCVPKKYLRVQFFILSDGSGPVVTEAELQPAIDKTREILKQQINVELLPYGSQMVEIIRDPAPYAALNPRCGGGAVEDELWGEAGDFFAQHLAGWNAVPLSATFPITVFVVADVGGEHDGCSLGPLTDYVTVDPAAITASGGVFGSPVYAPHLDTTAHEIGHACNLLFHVGSITNLMYGDGDERKGTELSWYQKNLFRSSRHVMYW
jgi:hypothetical protein